MMKLNLWPPAELRLLAKEKRLSQWHKWFAWRPVRVGVREFRWLEYVERRGTPPSWVVGEWTWDYRKPKL